MSDADKYQNSTSSALLEQLVYIDTFVNTGSSGDLTPNLNLDSQLSLDLAAFADDSFIFPDEDKPKNDDMHDDDDNIKMEYNGDNFNSGSSNLSNFDHIDIDSNDNESNIFDKVNISHLPKFPVPPGAKSSLVSAGLSSNQIELLSALVAQHQQLLGNSIPKDSGVEQTAGLDSLTTINLGSDLILGSSITSGSGTESLSQSTYTPQLPSQFYSGQVRQHNSINVDRFDNLIDNQIHSISSANLSSIHGSPSMTNISSDDTLTNLSVGGQTPNGSGQSSELDKRRRNTAASARFRIKKKIKEKQMESRIVHLNDVIKDFEVKIQQLQMENKLLRNLIIEKGSRKSEDELKVLKERAQRG